MSDRDFRAWLKSRLTTIDSNVKAPESLKDKIRRGIQEADQAKQQG